MIQGKTLPELRRERRELIATAALQGMLASDGPDLEYDKAAHWAVEFADALMEELDKPEPQTNAR